MSLVENTMYHQDSGKSKKAQLATSERCTGCSVCAAICPINAIHMIEDDRTHFLYPQIDESACIHCGKCSKVCPDIQKDVSKKNDVKEVYAANSLVSEIRLKSASGGIFGTLAKHVLKEHGAVVGVRYEGIDRCRHAVITELEQLDMLCGTKYFQSELQDIFEEVKVISEQISGIILFCGTPCQIQAMKNYAHEEQFESRLLTVELLCRGVPSYYLQYKYVQMLELKYGKKVCQFQMKEKSGGWNNIGIIVTFEDGSTVYEKGLESAFGRSFMTSNLAIRESCFHCNYKSIHRTGDITIGDFWGMKNSHLLDNKGTSAVLINSSLGQALFEKIRPFLDVQTSTLRRVYNGNRPAFEMVYCNTEKRRQFWDYMNQKIDLEEVLQRLEKN